MRTVIKAEAGGQKTLCVTLAHHLTPPCIPVACCQSEVLLFHHSQQRVRTRPLIYMMHSHCNKMTSMKKLINKHK